MPQSNAIDPALKTALLPVQYESEWKEGEFCTAAILNLETGAVTDIGEPDGDFLKNLIEESINVPGLNAPVIRTAEGACFVKDWAEVKANIQAVHQLLESLDQGSKIYFARGSLEYLGIVQSVADTEVVVACVEPGYLDKQTHEVTIQSLLPKFFHVLSEEDFEIMSINEPAFAGDMSKERFLALQAELEAQEMNFAKGQEVGGAAWPATQAPCARVSVVEALMQAAPWSLHPDEGCVRKLENLYALWDQLGTVPVSAGAGKVPAETLVEPFREFPAGTPREAVWHWFEEQNPNFLVGDVMQGIRHVKTLRSASPGM